MNWVLICEKNNRKTLENQMNSPQVLLGTLTEIDENIYEKVFENYNPHGVIVSDFGCEIPLKFKDLRQNLKVIYLTEITLENAETIEKLLNSGVIISEKLNFEKLLTSQEVREILADLRKKELEKITLETVENKTFEKAKKSKKYNISLSENTLKKDEWNGKKTLFINEREIEIPKGKVLIGISELQHHIGCTHISFEIAEFLRQQNLNSCVVIYDKTTYRNLCDFYGVSPASGFSVNNIRVYNYDMLEIATIEHQYIVCDYGFMRKSLKEDFAETNLKIMLVSGANWDLQVITDYLNSSEDSFKTDLNYLFYPIKQADFIRINKQFLRINCKAYRLQTSPECTLPCKENKAVFGKILGLKNKNKRK